MPARTPPTAPKPELPPHFVLTEDHSGLIAWPPGRPLREEEFDKFVRPAHFTARPWASLRQLPGSADASPTPVDGVPMNEEELVERYLTDVGLTVRDGNWVPSPIQ